MSLLKRKNFPRRKVELWGGDMEGREAVFCSLLEHGEPKKTYVFFLNDREGILTTVEEWLYDRDETNS